MSASAGAGSELPSTCDIAIVGAGPIGLMLANLLGAAGVDVVLVEQNDRLVGLPRAIAYDAETLRLFAQVGLFDAIANGLVQDPEVVYLNARGAKLMEMAPPQVRTGTPRLGTFYQPRLEQVLLAGLARFDLVRALFNRRVTSISQDRLGVEILVETPAGTRSLRAKFLVGCDGGNSSTRDRIWFAPRRLNLRRALARHRCPDRQSRCRQHHVLLRPAPARRAAARRRLARPLGIHAAARRETRGAGKR